MKWVFSFYIVGNCLIHGNIEEKKIFIQCYQTELVVTKQLSTSG